MFEIDGFRLFRRDRTGRRGGGVAIYCKRDLEPQPWSGSVRDDPKFEVLWLRTAGLRRINAFIGVIYNPPKPIYDQSNLLDYLEAMVEEISFLHPGSFISLSGDLN